MDTAARIQDRIETTQVAETIKYGQRAIDAMRGARGCTREYAGADWAIAQYEAAATVAEFLIGANVTTANAAWMFKRAAKIAREQQQDATATVKAAGTVRQLRMAMAVAA